MESPLLKYKSDRKAAYHSIEEQLDMIWHELNTNGTIASTYTDQEGNECIGTWFNHIQFIKGQHPKPTELDNKE